MVPSLPLESVTFASWISRNLREPGRELLLHRPRGRVAGVAVVRGRLHRDDRELFGHIGRADAQLRNVPVGDLLHHHVADALEHRPAAQELEQQDAGAEDVAAAVELLGAAVA